MISTLCEVPSRVATVITVAIIIITDVVADYTMELAMSDSSDVLLD